MQLPFSGKVAGMFASVEEKQEKRVQQLRRLEEISNRHREERLQQDQKRLHTLLTVQVSTTYRKQTEIMTLLYSYVATHPISALSFSVQELLEEGAVEQFHRRLMELNMDSAEELQSYIHKLSLSVEQHRLVRSEVHTLTQYISVLVCRRKPELDSKARNVMM